MLNVKRVMKLAPWFHELQMSSYLKSCDKILYSSERKYDFWAEKSLLEQQKARTMDLLTFSIKYDLNTVKIIAKLKIGDLLGQFLWGRGDTDNIDLAFVQELLQFFRPIQKSCPTQQKV